MTLFYFCAMLMMDLEMLGFCFCGAGLFFLCAGVMLRVIFAVISIFKGCLLAPPDDYIIIYSRHIYNSHNRQTFKSYFVYFVYSKHIPHYAIIPYT